MFKKDLNIDFTIGNCLSGLSEAVKLTNNADLDKYEYSGNGTGFDSRSEFLWTDGDIGKKVSSVHIDGRNENILILEEAKYSINFTESGKQFVLSWHYIGNNSFLFVNAVKMYQFKARNSERKPHPLCLGNISKDFTFNNMKKKKKKKKQDYIEF